MGHFWLIFTSFWLPVGITSIIFGPHWHHVGSLLELIPPALWASGGLEALQSKNPSIPSSLLPRGGVYPSPYPTLEAPPFANGQCLKLFFVFFVWIVLDLVGAAQIRSRCRRLARIRKDSPVFVRIR